MNIKFYRHQNGYTIYEMTGMLHISLIHYIVIELFPRLTDEVLLSEIKRIFKIK